MEKSRIKNWEELATNNNRKIALEVALSGLASIDTEEVISRSVNLTENILSVMGQTFDLSKFRRVKVVGFGKASVVAAKALEKILGDKIDTGAVVALEKAKLDRIETFVGTHPKPTKMNVDAGERIFEIIKGSTVDDLIIVLVSGGGSSLLCYGEDECRQSGMLYDEFLKSGKTIAEMNTIRKHLSVLKGGGLAKMAYPATVLGLIFSDIPGDHFDDVASGPTYKDQSTMADAEKIIENFNLGTFDLLETTKEDKYFEKVHNFVLVSNKTAVEAMAKKTEELGLTPVIISTEMYDEVGSALRRLFEAKKEGTIVLAAGEPMLEVKKKGGTGGRSMYMGLKAIQMGLAGGDSVLIPLASDGMDNSDSAGVIIDKDTIRKIKDTRFDTDNLLNNFDVYPLFQATKDAIITGPTGANVSDLMILLTKS